MDVEQQNTNFQTMLTRDNEESLIKRNIINQLMIETEANEKRIFRKPQPI